MAVPPPPPHCAVDTLSTVNVSEALALGLTSADPNTSLPEGIECFKQIDVNQTEDYFEFERSMAVCNASVCFLGVVGNILAVVVLLSKDMRKNCFSQLLTGWK